MKFLGSLFINNRLLLALSTLCVLFAVSYAYSWLFMVAQILLVVVAILVFLDIFFLYLPKGEITAEREVSPQLSLGDKNPVHLTISNNTNLPVSIILIDELPFQLQKRDFNMKLFLKAKSNAFKEYTILPNKRGEYNFGNIQLFTSSVIGLLTRRITVNTVENVAVYPSILQMKKMELKLLSKTASLQGIKKIRRLGNNNEFEQIKQYVVGDNYKHINWKATSRKNELMVNQYQDERSQQVYSIIDKSRVMRMPFDNMSLLDYAINSSLVFSNTAMLKGDKAGVLTFSNKLGSSISAERNPTHLKKIIELLYKQKTEFLEANYELLYYGIRKYIKGRSLIMLYTNFESVSSVQRALPLLRRINQNHLLIVVMFENTEINEHATKDASTIKEIYNKTIAEKFKLDKQLIVQELRKYGIQTILTTPKQLSIDAVNKYLEVKSRGML